MVTGKEYDVVIIGAGAAGLFCAIEAGKRGRSVIILDHAPKIAEKIRISGGGRCNFTNIHTAPDKYISQNPKFCTSALKRYGAQEFIALVNRHGIAWHEKTLGQLFCDHSAQDIITMLQTECADAGAVIAYPVSVSGIEQYAGGDGFRLETGRGPIVCRSLVIATGGLSIPKIGASAFGFKIAEQFGIPVIPPRAGLVPLTFAPELLEQTKLLSGISLDPVRAAAACGMHFDEAMLFTHRGISGPAILQISSYWKQGEEISVNLHTAFPVLDWLKTQRKEQAKSMLRNVLPQILPRRLAEAVVMECGADARMADLGDAALKNVAGRIEGWRVKPAGSEGYRTAEVTLGGVDTKALSSKTFEASAVPGLYFIGEVVDVTGHLGGYNFQWAWSSGWCAGQYV